MNRINKALENVGILPVINIKTPEYKNTLLAALSKTDICCIEVTLRSDYSLEAIKSIKEENPDMIVGAGTVMNMQDLEKALSVGADYIVSPGLDEEIVSYCIKNNIHVVPGVSTPSEVMLALKLGCKTVKLFPAELSGGTKLLKLYEGAFAGTKFLPTGGITTENAKDYFACKNVIALGGSFMASEAMLKENDTDSITSASNKLISQYREIRGI